MRRAHTHTHNASNLSSQTSARCLPPLFFFSFSRFCVFFLSRIFEEEMQSTHSQKKKNLGIDLNALVKCQRPQFNEDTHFYHFTMEGNWCLFVWTAVFVQIIQFELRIEERICWCNSHVMFTSFGWSIYKSCPFSEFALFQWDETQRSHQRCLNCHTAYRKYMKCISQLHSIGEYPFCIRIKMPIFIWSFGLCHNSESISMILLTVFHSRR